MKKVKLKDGLSLDIEIWNVKQLEDHTRRLPIISKASDIHFEGFSLFNSTTLCPERKKERNKKRYSDEKRLSELELQADRTLPNEEYDRAIVAFDKGTLAGIYLCRWMKNDPYNIYYSFWKYLASILETRQGYERRGIATELTRALDKAEFIKGRILQTSEYTDMGEKFIRKVIEKELKAEDYVLLPGDYWPKDPPKAFGRYDRLGHLIE